MMKKMVIVIMICLLLTTTVYAEIDIINEELFDLINITQWHNEGYTGKGLVIVVSDCGKINPNSVYINTNNIIDYYGDLYDENLNETSHMEATIQVLQMIAPDATLYPIDKPNAYAVHVAVEVNANILTASKMLGAYSSNIVVEGTTTKMAYDAEIFMNGASGNDIETRSDSISNPHWFSTGAARLTNGKFIRTDYSSYGEGLDMLGPTDIVMVAKGDDNLYAGIYTGTSASTPVISAMVALYQQRYYETQGVYPTIETTRQFIYENCADLEEVGYDMYTGYGLFILPNIVD